MAGAEWPRRRGGVPMPAAAESEMEKVGEVEWTTGKLTISSNRAEKGRRWFVEGRAELRWRTSMAGGGLEHDPAGVGLNQARRGAGQVWGKAREAGARRIEAGATGMACAASGGSSARALRDVSTRKKMRRAKTNTTLWG